MESRTEQPADHAGTTEHALLEVRNVSKAFPGVRALQDVSFDIRRGEVLALVGENGAGKSTVIKVLSGVHAQDSGSVMLDGEEVVLNAPDQAQRAGIQTIYQEHSLAPDLNAVQNVFLGRELHRGPFLDERAMKARTRELFREFGAPLEDLEREVASLGALKQRLIEIIKALAFDARVVIMDEPTAALPEHERETLFGHIRALRDRGVAVVIVTHRLEELFGLADRAVVLRDGRFVGDVDLREATVDTLVRMMVGREIGNLERAVARDAKLGPSAGEELLRVEGVRRAGVLDDVSFTLRRGEILGVAGLAGSGRTELARAIIGADRRDAGEIHLDGRRIKASSPGDALVSGIALVPEERKVQAILADFSVARNISISSLGRVQKGRFGLDRRREHEVAERYVTDLGIRTPSIHQKIGLLSGGNQQKAIVARSLFAGAKVVIFDEPTQGVDVGAKLEIYRLIQTYVEEGGSAIVISSELPELLAFSDRVLVMRRGAKAGEVWGRGPAATDEQRRALEEEVMGLATSGARAGHPDDLEVHAHDR
jgi:ABC-type sugar transport system ATPase subunit